MAFTRLFFATSLFVLLWQTTVSTNDYGNGTYAQNPQEETAAYNNGPKHLDQVQPKDYTHSVPKPDFKKPNPEEYLPKPTPDGYIPNASKPEFNKPNPEGYLPKPTPDGYIPNVPSPMPALDKLSKPKLNKPEYEAPKRGLDTEKSLPICVEGLVLCKNGPKFTPIKGAVSRITCLGNDENGYEKSVSIVSSATDEYGYFFQTLSINFLENLKVTECKVYIENSPSETCKVPTDINNGISGALLNVYRILKEKQIKLYTVQPLVFTPEPTIPNGY